MQPVDVRPVEALFIALARHGRVLEPLLTLAGDGRLQGSSEARTLAVRTGLGTARQPEVVEALQAAEAAGVTARASGDQWRVKLPAAVARELATLLRGARLYRESVHADRDTVCAVVSMPAAPSQLVEVLRRTLEGSWGLETTEAVFGQLAEAARQRFTVMTPFIDDSGAQRVVELFSATTAGVQRELIIRGGLPAALVPRADALRSLGVAVFDFRIPRLPRPDTETFHAKVVRVDDGECYVGSSNMTRWSFTYSLELGVHLRGQAARAVSRVLDAVVAVSTPVII